MNNQPPNSDSHELSTKLENIKAKVLTYYDRMREVSLFLYENNAPEHLQIILKKQYLQFYIDKDSLAEILKIAMLDHCDSLVVLFGLDDFENQSPISPDSNEFGQVTGCFLGVEKDGSLLRQHCHFMKKGKDGSYNDDPVQGQDTWPPKTKPPYTIDNKTVNNTISDNSFTLDSDKQKIIQFFSKHTPKPDLES